jgi:imidazolonepropionase
MSPTSGAILNARVCSMQGSGLGLLERTSVAWTDGRVHYIGPDTGVPAVSGSTLDAGGALLTPGMVDCHTHLVYAGQRANEFEARLAGATYSDIARGGGGIAATVRATRAAGEDSLLTSALPRARQLLGDGVTTIEIKSGYGLDLDTEARMLRVARRIGVDLGITVRTTALCAHAVPVEFAGNADGYIDLVCREILPGLVQRGLVDAVDAFCEGIGFSPLQTRRVFDSARALGLPVKLHADQLSDLGGAALVAEYGGLSADHVEFCSPAGVDALAASGAVAVLLPGAFYALRETRQPPVAAFRDRKVPMAVATDLNPGTSPLASLRLAMNMACVLFGLTVEEALRGVTVNAARALGLTDRGRIALDAAADLVLWPVESPAELAYWIGGLAPAVVVAKGVRVRRSEAAWVAGY